MILQGDEYDKRIRKYVGRLTRISKQGHFAKNDILLVEEILPNPR